MKVVSLLSAVLLAGTAMALPSPEDVEKMKSRRHQRLRNRRAAHGTKGGFLTRHSQDGKFNPDITPGPTQYDDNWAGAYEIDSGITQVVGTFTNPAVTVGTGQGQGVSGVAYWVGIDGATCQNAILQTGVSAVITDGGAPVYAAWYEWYPHISYTFSGFEVEPGHSITAHVVATSTVSGNATIYNHSTGKHVTKVLANQGYALCQTNAEWIAENFEGGLPNFGTVNFAAAYYEADGVIKTPNGSTIVEINNGGVIANASLHNKAHVKVEYSG